MIYSTVSEPGHSITFFVLRNINAIREDFSLFILHDVVFFFYVFTQNVFIFLFI